MAKHEKQDETQVDTDAVGSQAHYERFLPEALALGGEPTWPRVSVQTAYHNVAQGTAAVLTEKARLQQELPTLALDEVAALPELVLAVLYADDLIDPHAPKPTRTMQSRAATLRKKLLTTANALVLAGLLPEHEVALIRRGTGAFDVAEDCIALTRLFQGHAQAIAGKHAVTTDEVREAAELGTELRTLLRPKHTHTAPPPEALAQATERRDRLWALLVSRYDRVRRAGAWLFGVEHVDERVPALGAHKAARKKAEATAAG